MNTIQKPRPDATPLPPNPDAVRITAPARLHLGFLDLSGGLGRRFGSLGVTLERPLLTLAMRRAAELSASGPDAARARSAVEKAARHFGLDSRVAVTVETGLPPHAGLGSGTQLSLACASALALLQGRTLAPAEIGAALDRGARSAIGIGAFTMGGVLLDGGKSTAPEGRNVPPPLLARHAFPADWRIVLAYDHTHRGLSGLDEVRAMDELPPFPDELAGRIARLTLMVALPALVEGAVEPFGRAIGEIQRRLGEHYAHAQGGRYTSPAVAEAMAWVESQGIAGIGQSSWGPTGFAIIGDSERAAVLLKGLRERFGTRPGLAFDSVRGRNSGALIETAPAAGDAVKSPL